MALSRKIVGLILVQVLTAAPVYARRGKTRTVPQTTTASAVVIPPRPRARPAEIVTPLPSNPRAPLAPLAPSASQSLPLFLDKLPLPHGMTVVLDRTLRLHLDLPTLLGQVAQPSDTVSVTLEAQSGSAWLWLTYRIPSAATPLSTGQNPSVPK